MIVQVVMEHKIKRGKERETLELIKGFNQKALMANGSRQRQLPESAEHGEGGSNRLDCFAELGPLSDTPASIRVYLTQ